MTSIEKISSIIAKPLKTLNEINDWSEEAANAPVCVPIISQSVPVDGPKLIVCHDMRGGYLDDRFNQGCSNSDAYRIQSWYLIDTFIYFSHHFVTIPPPCWINVAHKNGTKVLGTVITEWKEGKDRCEEFLKSEESVNNFVEKLVGIAKVYQFDGWLVNIENEVDDTSNLLQFLKDLTSRIHEDVPNGQVIWYDSVVENGKLKWQNELNNQNSMFYQCCDGIFLNYTWNEANLSQSKDECYKMSRFYDVYVGMDAFGRGCHGGGGLNCISALDLIQKHDLSVALFAPGWTHETNNSKYSCQLERSFWNQFSNCPFQKRNLTSLPINTSFCQGSGHGFFHEGEKLIFKDWHNLCAQELQPNIILNKVEISQKDAYNGGACLLIDATSECRIPLFSTNIPVIDDICITYAVKCEEEFDMSDIYIDLLTDESTSVTESLQKESSLIEKRQISVRNGWHLIEIKLFCHGVIRRIDVVTNLVKSQSFLLGMLSITLVDYIQSKIEKVIFSKSPLSTSPFSASPLSTLPLSTSPLSREANTSISSSSTHIPKFLLSWLPGDNTSHYSILMHYLNLVEPVSEMMLLGQTYDEQFLVEELVPSGKAENWDFLRFVIVPSTGSACSVQVSKCDILNDVTRSLVLYDSGINENTGPNIALESKLD